MGRHRGPGRGGILRVAHSGDCDPTARLGWRQQTLSFLPVTLTPRRMRRTQSLNASLSVTHRLSDPAMQIPTVLKATKFRWIGAKLHPSFRSLKSSAEGSECLAPDGPALEASCSRGCHQEGATKRWKSSAPEEGRHASASFNHPDSKAGL